MAIRGRRDAFGPTVKNPLAGARQSVNKSVVVTQNSRLVQSVRQRYTTQILNLPKPPPPPPPPPIGTYLPVIQVANRRTSYRPRVGVQSTNPLANPTFHVFAPRLKITKGSDIYRVPIHNLSATVAPATSNDASQGYTPGSEWIDTTHQNAYICVSNTPGAAVWKSVVTPTTTLTGDVTGSGAGSISTTIANNSVTYAKMQQLSNGALLGRASSGNVSEVSLGTGLTFVGSSLTAYFGDAYVSTDRTTTSSSFASAGMPFFIHTKEVWSIEYALYIVGSAAGVQFQLTASQAISGVLIFTYGNTTSSTAFSSDSQSALSTPSAAYLSSSASGLVIVRVLITNGSAVSANIIDLQYASATNTQTNIIKAGSYCRPRYVTTLP